MENPVAKIQLRLLGIGNPFRGDDGIGPCLVQSLDLQDTGLECLPVVCRGDFAEVSGILEKWQQEDPSIPVVLVDAIQAENEVKGRTESVPAWRVWDLRDGPIPEQSIQSSTHTLGLGKTLELARVMGFLPERCLLFGVLGRHFAMGSGLSVEMVAKTEHLQAQLKTALIRWMDQNRG